MRCIGVSIHRPQIDAAVTKERSSQPFAETAITECTTWATGKSDNAIRWDTITTNAVTVLVAVKDTVS